MNTKYDTQRADAVHKAIMENTAKMYQRSADLNRKRASKYTYTENQKSYEPRWFVKALSWLINTALDLFIFGSLTYFVFEILPQLIKSIPVTYK